MGESYFVKNPALDNFSHEMLGRFLRRAEATTAETPIEQVKTLAGQIDREASGLGRLNVLEVKRALNRLKGFLPEEDESKEMQGFENKALTE